MRHDPTLAEQLVARRDRGRDLVGLAGNIAAIAAAAAAFALVPGRALFAWAFGS